MKIIITGTDVETTGFKAEEGDRITEVAMLVYELDSDTMVMTAKGKFNTLVNPLRSIPEVVQQITHITPALVKDAPTWKDVAPKVSKILTMTDILIAHNADFDSVFLALELQRLKLSFNQQMQVFCTMENGRFATPLGKCPKLTELCWSLGVEFNDKDAHRAIYDTMKMMQAVDVGLTQGYFDLKEVVEKVIKNKKLKEVA